MKRSKNLSFNPLKALNIKGIIYSSIILLMATLFFLIVYSFNNLHENTKIIILCFLIFSSFLLCLVLLAFNALMSSMKSLINSSIELSKGNLNISDIIIMENNDLKILAKAFNQLKTNLLFFIDNTKKNITTLSQVIETSSTSMDMTCKGNDELAGSIQDIASNAQEQLVLVNDTVSKIDNIHNIINNISKNMNDVEKMTLSSNSISIEGKESLNAYSESVLMISDSMSNTGEFISMLRKSISEITNVTNFIIDISDNLRLLSLNASIEAARSGEAGKGFAVVADEITKLSDSAKDEISKINSIISNVLENSNKVEKSISSSINDFEKGKETFSKVQDVFNNIHDKNSEILKQVNEVVSEVTSINSISNETYLMSKKVYESSSSVSEATESAVAVIEEEVAELHEINETISSLNAFIEKIEKSTTIFDIGVKPINNSNSKNLNIAFILPGIKGSFFWNTILNGIQYAKRELAAKKTNVEIILVPFKNVKDFENDYIKTIEQCIENKYDGICLHGGNAKFIPNVDKAVSKGIPVMTFNADFTDPSKRLACVRPNAYEAGAIAGEIMKNKVNGKGQIVVVANKSPNTDATLKENGFSDYVKKQNSIKIYDKYITPENGEEAYKLFKEYLSKNSNNIDGIFLCGLYKHNIAKAIDELGLAGKLKFIVYDVDAVTCDYIKKDIITCAIGLDPFSQGHDSTIHLYNYLINGNKPESENIWTRVEIIDSENVDRILS